MGEKKEKDRQEAHQKKIEADRVAELEKKKKEEADKLAKKKEEHAEKTETRRAEEAAKRAAAKAEEEKTKEEDAKSKAEEATKREESLKKVEEEKKEKDRQEAHQKKIEADRVAELEKKKEEEKKINDRYTYITYHAKFAGATNYHGARTVRGVTAQQCKALCTVDPDCDCVSFQKKRKKNKCWKRKNCVPSKFSSGDSRCDVFVKVVPGKTKEEDAKSKAEEATKREES